MSKFINTIDLLGDQAVMDALLRGTLEEFRDNTVKEIAGNAFTENKKLAYLNLPNVVRIGDGAFGNCSSLKTLILSSETMCTIGAWPIEGTPLKNGTGYVYVPRALIDSYKTATSWSTIANQFRALEDYTVDGTVTGELDESKI
jgi:hypothetical protein